MVGLCQNSANRLALTVFTVSLTSLFVLETLSGNQFPLLTTPEILFYAEGILSKSEAYDSFCTHLVLYLWGCFCFRREMFFIFFPFYLFKNDITYICSYFFFSPNSSQITPSPPNLSCNILLVFNAGFLQDSSLSHKHSSACLFFSDNGMLLLSFQANILWFII